MVGRDVPIASFQFEPWKFGGAMGDIAPYLLRIPVLFVQASVLRATGVLARAPFSGTMRTAFSIRGFARFLTGAFAKLAV